MTVTTKNLSASVHARLLNIARERNIPFNSLLQRYGIERLLYRLSKSEHASRFVLKGAMLFELWSQYPHRSTRDLDLLGFGNSSIVATRETFEELCRMTVQDDGLRFDSSTLVIEEIKSLDEYLGTRVRFTAFLGSARIPLQVDIGVGDAVIPPAEEVVYPTLLNFPAPSLRAYNKETAIAEKLHAMAVRGMLNTRMKDYFDIYYLVKTFSFESTTIRRSILSTFERRETAIPTTLPLGLTKEFSADTVKQQQWLSFLTKVTSGEEAPSLEKVVTELGLFFSPVLSSDSAKKWSPGGPWE